MSTEPYTEPGWYVIHCDTADTQVVQWFDIYRLHKFNSLKPTMEHVNIYPVPSATKEKGEPE